MNVTLLHHGAVDGVTGSCHQVLLANGSSILVDCGLFQGAENSSDGVTAEQPQITFPVDRIQALVVTHVHIDHVGRIPYLLAAGFKGAILCSQASAILLPLMLEDALKVGFTRDQALIERFLDEIRRRVIALPYKQWHSVMQGDTWLRVRLAPAGHILGSAYVECECGFGKERQRLVFSGDLGAPYTPLLPTPQSPYGADVVILESTYGDRRHDNRHNRRYRLQVLVERVLRDRGSLLIPAFSIGRTQELLYELEQIIHQSRQRAVAPGMIWDDLEIIVDSPLAASFTTAYQQLSEYWDQEAKRTLSAGRHPLNFEQLTTISDHATHLQTVDYLTRTARPTIILAASGMCAGGRIVNYLKAMLGDPRHDILFIGYQAEGTPGRAIQTHGPQGGYVDLDGQRYPIRAGVHTLGGYSAHADQHDLLNFIERIRNKPRQIRLVHGEKAAKQALARELRQRYPRMEIVIP